MLAQRDKLNVGIQKLLDEQTESWGIKVANVEIKHIDIDESMIRAIAKQAEAERERRAKVIHADGELQASTKLLEAATTLVRSTPGASTSLHANADRGVERSQLDHRISRCLLICWKHSRIWCPTRAVRTINSVNVHSARALLASV